MGRPILYFETWSSIDGFKVFDAVGLSLDSLLLEKQWLLIGSRLRLEVHPTFWDFVFLFFVIR